MNEFITRFLAELLEKFKVANPKTYAVIMVALFTLIYFAQRGTLLGLFELSPFLASVVEWLGIVLGSLFSSSTFGFLSPLSQMKRPPVSPPK